MKKLVYIFMLVLGVQFVYAQEDYVPFPKADAEWRTLRINKVIEPARDVITYSLFGSEIIEDTLYGVIYSSKKIYTEEECDYFVFREEDKRIFVRISNLGEHLLYDFNLDIGDTIFYNVGGFGHRNSIYFSSSFHYKIVESIDTIVLADDSKRKRFNLVGSWMGNGKDTWIEGVGSIKWLGFLNPFINDITWGGDSYSFACFSHNSTVYYLDSIQCESCSCWRSPNNNVTDIALLDISISPNPTSDKLKIKSEELGITNIKFFDMLGREIILPILINQSEIEIDTKNMSSELYLIQIVTDKGIITRKFVKQ